MLDSSGQPDILFLFYGYAGATCEMAIVSDRLVLLKTCIDVGDMLVISGSAGMAELSNSCMAVSTHGNTNKLLISLKRLHS